MQFTSPQSKSREQIICNFFITRGGVWDTLSAAGGFNDAGRSLRGVIVSYAIRDADLVNGMGIDVVIPDITNGIAEDLCYPAGVMVDDVIIQRSNPAVGRQWVRVCVFGAVEQIFCQQSGTLMHMRDTNDNGAAQSIPQADFTQNRKLFGSGSLTAPGTFNLAADASAIDWTSAGSAGGYDTMALQGLLGTNVPTAGHGFVGICKSGAPTTVVNGPSFITTSVKAGIVMCMSTSVGRV